MNAIVAVALAAGLVIAGLIRSAVGDMLQTEIQTRLSAIPGLLVNLALRSIPEEFRAEFGAEWHAEADYIVAHTDGLPITRLVRCTWYAASLLTNARSVAASLGPQNPPVRGHLVLRFAGWPTMTAGVALMTAAITRFGFGLSTIEILIGQLSLGIVLVTSGACLSLKRRRWLVAVYPATVVEAVIYCERYGATVHSRVTTTAMILAAIWLLLAALPSVQIFRENRAMRLIGRFPGE